MTIQNNGKTTGLGGVTGKGFQPGQSGNPGGRPAGLAKLAREAVGDGTDLIAFYSAILRGDAKTLGVRQIRLQDRLEAAEWLAERGWGKGPLIVDLPDEPRQANLRELLLAWVESLPPDLRKAFREQLHRQFHAAIDADIAVIEEQVKATIPEG